MGAAAPFVPYIAAAVFSAVSTISQQRAANKQAAATKQASQAEQAKNEEILAQQRAEALAEETRQQNAMLLQNQGVAGVAQTVAGGSAALSEDTGITNSEIQRRKRNASQISTTLGV